MCAGNLEPPPVELQDAFLRQVVEVRGVGVVGQLGLREYVALGVEDRTVEL